MKPVFVAFDTETTGLEPESCEICEIAGVKFTVEGGKPVIKDQYSTLVHIEGSIPAEVSRINNIYESMLAGAPHPKEAIGGFLRWAGQSTILLAHHAAFDVAFLGQAIKEQELVVPRNPTFCTKRIACRLMPGRHRLQDLEMALVANSEEWLAYKGTGRAHRALYDSQMLAFIFSAMATRGIPNTAMSDVQECLKYLSHLDGAKRAFDMPMDSHQLQQEFDAMKAMGVR